MTKEIKLTHGKVATVDDHWFEYLSQWNWACMKQGSDIDDAFYAFRTFTKPDGKRQVVFMHNVILPSPDGMETDHKDGNGLNNQESNLRHSTHTQNVHNSKKRRDNTSGFKGVHWLQKKKRWAARIQVDGRRIYLGMHKTAEIAARKYDEAAKKYFGEFAKLNFQK